MAGRLTKVGKAFYLCTMPGHPFPDSPVLINSARSYLRRADFLMSVVLPSLCQLHESPAMQELKHLHYWSSHQRFR
jgi:hypothetical protein